MHILSACIFHSSASQAWHLTLNKRSFISYYKFNSQKLHCWDLKLISTIKGGFCCDTVLLFDGIVFFNGINFLNHD